MAQPISTAVIMAAGRGTRLFPYTEEIPKGFIEIDGQTLIERSIRILQQNGIHEIIIGCGHKSHHFENIKEKYGLTLFYNEDFSGTDSLYTMVLAAPYVSSAFLLLESDLLYAPEAISFLLKSTFENSILASGFTNSDDEVYIETDADHNLKNMSKEATAREKAYGELVGISKISLDVMKDLAAEVAEDPSLRKLKYEDGLVDITKKHPIKIEKLEDLVWCEIDNEDHLIRAKELIYPKLINLPE